MLPGDKARIGSFSNRIQVDPRDFTSDHEELLHILRTELQEEGPTPLWNAINVGITALLHQQGRRVVLVFTDGMDSAVQSGGVEQLAQGRHEARRRRRRHGVRHRPRRSDPNAGADTRHGRGGYPRGGGFGRGGFGEEGSAAARSAEGAGRVGQTRRRPAEDRGGDRRGLLRVDVHEPTSAATFAKVADELHHQYALGFTPEKLDGKMHTLDVRAGRRGRTVRARKSYLAKATGGGAG